MKLSEGLRKGLAIKEKIGRPYCAAVIVAAGTSSRMGGTNKILTVLENLPVICRTVDVFDKCAMIDEIIVVTQQEFPEGLDEGLGKLRLFELPDNGVGAIGDEYVAESFRLLQQTTLQQRHLVMEGFHGFGLLQGFEL